MFGNGTDVRDAQERTDIHLDKRLSSDPRFWSHVTRGDGCWEWQGSRDRQGYGRVLRVAISRSPFQAHRYAWLLTRGELPAGIVIRHSCDNPPCVRPDHLLGGTQGDNIADRQARGRHHPGRFPGEAHPMHKLTDEDVLVLRALRRKGVPVNVLARRFGISAGATSLVATGRTWSHLPGAVPPRRYRKAA